ncbi:MAG: aminotransferase class V-fold PLP-dependent enzyme [Phycisphaerales bacterium]|nr:MAG: aminotransferase class V-fold PLP-dependent enzyme [Phycisphaerales bacterium]
MSAEAFRQHGRAVIDWIADYLEHIEQHPVQSPLKPNDVRAQLPAHPPERGESFEQMLRDVNEIILPGLTHWQSPNFFGYFPANTSYPSILGELLTAGLGVQGMLWATSPACTELETHVLDWVVELLDLPREFRSTSAGGGVIQDTASSATLCAMLAARERVTGNATNERGANGTLTVYTSQQTHSSIEKAATIAGIGRANLRLIDVDDHFAMKPASLRQTLRADRAAGKVPAFVCATVGTTSSNAIDPVREIGEICREEQLWLHVDAAMSGTAALCPEFRHIHDGLELADSYCFNPHKWMFTNFDCDCFFVRDRAALVRTLSILPEYLRNTATESGNVIDYRDWQIPLGRRFRALKLWFVIRHYGAEGLRGLVREHISLAQEFADWVRESDRFELITDPPLNLVCLRHIEGDGRTQAILKSINDSGRAFLTHTKLNDRYVIRVSIGGTRTRRQHVEALWRQLRDLA